jgi:alcohol dehydrogenase class IV
MAQALGLKSELGESVVQYLFDLNSKVGIPHRLREIQVKESHLDTLSALAFADFAHPNNPKPVSQSDFKALYQEAL